MKELVISQQPRCDVSIRREYEAGENLPSIFLINGERRRKTCPNLSSFEIKLLLDTRLFIFKLIRYLYIILISSAYSDISNLKSYTFYAKHILLFNHKSIAYSPKTRTP